MRAEIVIPAQSRVVTPAEVREYLGFGSTEDDPAILEYIDSSTEAVESFTGLTAVETTYKAWSRVIDEDIDLPRWPLIEVISTFNTDGDVSVYEVFEDEITLTEPSKILFTAGYLRPASVASDVVTLTAHGYVNGDSVIIDGTKYTASSVTTDTFQVSPTIDDGSVMVGYLPADLKSAIKKHAAKQYLKEADLPLSMEIKNEIKKLRRTVAFI